MYKEKFSSKFSKQETQVNVIANRTISNHNNTQQFQAYLRRNYYTMGTIKWQRHRKNGKENSFIIIFKNRKVKTTLH